MLDIEDQQPTEGARPSLPRSPADKKKLKTMLSEATYCKQRIDDEKDNIKGIVESIFQQFEIPKKLGNKLVNVLYKQDYANRVSEEEDFQYLYEAIVEVKLDADGKPTKGAGDRASAEEVAELYALLADLNEDEVAAFTGADDAE